MQSQEVSHPHSGSAEKQSVSWLVTTIPQNDSSSEFKGREGDFLELKDGSIFEVKGLIHPPDRLIAYPRYIPDEKGDRQKGTRRYRKIYPLKDRYNLLKQRYPHLLIYDPVFNIQLPEAPRTEVAAHHRPDEVLNRLREEKSLDETEQRAVEFSHLLEDRSGVSSSTLGVSGSIMIGLHTDSSDIDVMVYGRGEALRVREALRNLLNEEEQVRPYTADELVRLYRFRVVDTVMPFEDFARHEKRKTFQGVFRDREFFIRYLPCWPEVGEAYGSIRYRPAGYVKVKAKVRDASESFYTPCRYLLEQVESLKGVRVQDIVEAVSLRGRFCEQAEAGEYVVIQGKLEKVTTSAGEHHRVLLGGSPSDFMISLSL